MNTSDLINKIANDQGLPHELAKAIVDNVFRNIAEAAQHGQEITFSGFGKFKVKAKPQLKSASSPTAGNIKLKASKQFLFQPRKLILDLLNYDVPK